MKAIRVHEFGSREIMQLEKVPDPKFSAGQILVCLQSVGVNPFDAH